MFFWERNENKLRIFAYKDASERGKNIVRVARGRGIWAKLFEDPSKVPNEPNTIAFVYMLHDPKFYSKGVDVAGKIALKDKVLMIPRPHEARLFHSKIALSKAYPEWMPPTWHITDADEAVRVLEKMEFPLVSKSNESFSSVNVRLVKNRNEALREIELAFSEDGIPMYGGVRQKGYLLWQEFMPGNKFDYRVFVVGKRFAALGKRYVRDDIPFASGSGRDEPMPELNDEAREVLAFSLDFTRKVDRTIAVMDIVRNKKGGLTMVEVHATWGRTRYSKAAEKLQFRMFEFKDGNWVKSKFFTTQFFDCIVEAMVNGDFNVPVQKEKI